MHQLRWTLLILGVLFVMACLRGSSGGGSTGDFSTRVRSNMNC